MEEKKKRRRKTKPIILDDDNNTDSSQPKVLQPHQIVWEHIRTLKGWPKSADALFSEHSVALAKLASFAKKGDTMDIVLQGITAIAKWFESVRNYRNWNPRDIIPHYLSWRVDPDKYLPYKDELDRLKNDPEYRKQYIDQNVDVEEEKKNANSSEKWFKDRYVSEPEFYDNDEENSVNKGEK